jgi:hypothetical protein
VVLKFVGAPFLAAGAVFHAAQLISLSYSLEMIYFALAVVNVGYLYQREPRSVYLRYQLPRDVSHRRGG